VRALAGLARTGGYWWATYLGGAAHAELRPLLDKLKKRIGRVQQWQAGAGSSIYRHQPRSSSSPARVLLDDLTCLPCSIDWSLVLIDLLCSRYDRTNRPSTSARKRPHTERRSRPSTAGPVPGPSSSRSSGSSGPVLTADWPRRSFAPPTPKQNESFWSSVRVPAAGTSR
jgi:hypothetical protein